MRGHATAAIHIFIIYMQRPSHILNYIYFTALFFFTAALQAHGRPSEEGIRRIESTYDPRIQVRLERPRAVSNNGKCWFLRVAITGRDPVHFRSRDVKIHEYAPKTDSQTIARAPAVLILPPTGGTNLIDRNYARMLCEQGFRAVILHGWEDPTENSIDWKCHDNTSLRALTAVRHVVEYIRPSRERRLGVLGTSAGSLTAAFALGVDPRIEAGYLIVPGANLPEILAESDLPRLVRLRARRMKHFHLANVRDYLRHLEQEIVFRLEDFLDYSGTKPVQLILALKDKTVPTRYQRDLARLYKKASVIEMPYGHKLTVVNSFRRHKELVLKFFEAHLR
jgi:hypothetical protein